MMDLEHIQELICKDMEQEYDSANELREQSPSLASYREGVAAGLSRAMMYLDLVALDNKKAAMPVSTAADPLEKRRQRFTMKLYQKPPVLSRRW